MLKNKHGFEIKKMYTITVKDCCLLNTYTLRQVLLVNTPYNLSYTTEELHIDGILFIGNNDFVLSTTQVHPKNGRLLLNVSGDLLLTVYIMNGDDE